ncbi:MAG: hypothetical protein IKG80_04785, partial [Clostridia bacterium]|nr:hypothetical protein [Clostridia bacterium]
MKTDKNRASNKTKNRLSVPLNDYFQAKTTAGLLKESGGRFVINELPRNVFSYFNHFVHSHSDTPDVYG